MHIWSLLNEKCDVSFSLFLCSSYIFLKDDKGRIFGLESRESNIGFHIACNVGQFDVVELVVNNCFGINLNAQHVKGITLLSCTVIRYSYEVK